MTGVQTCALPIPLFTALMVYIGKGFAVLSAETFLALREIVYLSFPRSEERRVGKECRSRWGPLRSKKKRTMLQGQISNLKHKWKAGEVRRVGRVVRDVTRVYEGTC